VNDTVLDRLARALEFAQEYDPNVFTGPIALLWPDQTRQWESVIPELRGRLRIASFGPYAPEAVQGPAYWLRCFIASTIEIDDAVAGLPIVYLPGVSRDVLRGLGTVAADIAPVAALQHRCQWFSHPNGKDWTIRALLSNKERGLGLDVAPDDATAEALVASLAPLAKQPLSRLQSKRIDVDFLNALVNPDPIRSLLIWLDDPTGIQNGPDNRGWSAFVQQCKRDFGFDPATHGELEGARLLGEAEGAWAQVWRRFCENPTDYPRIPDRLRAARPYELFSPSRSNWPQDNDAAEEQLGSRLLDLAALSPQGARTELERLENEHRGRRNSVWAQLGAAPLANSLDHLAELARATSSACPDNSVGAIATWYATTGWRGDRAAIGALDEVKEKLDVTAVSAALTSVYRPWLDAAARALQTAIGPHANAGSYVATPAPSPAPGDVVVFIDGLRLDIANLLAERLNGSGLEVEIEHGLAALPTVTQTAKPALVPIDQSRLAAGTGLDACRAPAGPSAGVQVLRSLLNDEHIQVLTSDEVGDVTGTAWTETGKIDSRGHELGVELVHEIDDQIQRIASRIKELLDAGWYRVRVVTDHGWLLVPGGLPKNENLPVAVTEAKKGRCARVKDGAVLSIPTVPWHWDHNVRIAIAPGISCFEANKTYEHGGVSPQECIVPRLNVGRPGPATSGATITNSKWRGLALVVEFEGLPDGVTVDLRTGAGDPASSIADMGRVTGGKGKVILLVGDEDLEGQQAQLVVIGVDGSLLLQRATTVGHNR